MSSRPPYRIPRVLALGCWLVCIAGCANPPSLELNEARAALALARDYEADVYAPDQYANALMNLQLAEAEIDDQASVPRMARSYERASAFLTFAVEEAEEARILAEEFKEDIFRQAEGNLPEAEDALETAYQTYNNALGILAYQEAQSMARSLDEARQSLPEARRLIETGAAAQAAALLNEVLVTARSIETRAQFIIDTNPDTN